MYCAKKAKGLFSILKYQKFQALISKWDVLFKNDQMLWFVKKPNEKFLIFVIIFLWEVIYVHFYNWNRPLDLVLVVYDLIELIIETLLWSKDYSTFDTHPQHTSLVQLMLISFVWLYMIKCDVCVLNHIWIKPKRFLFFLFAFRGVLYHPYFSKFFKLFLSEKHVFWVFSLVTSRVRLTYKKFHM